MISRKAAFISGAVTALVLGSGTAYAANGGSFTLGAKNTATKTSTLVNTKGTALKLQSKRGTAPLAVSSSVKVTNLNSDTLDGVSSEQFLRSTGKAVDADKLDGLSSEQFLRSTGKAVDAESVDGIDSSALALAAGATSYVVANGTFFDVDSNGTNDSLIAVAVCPAGTKLTGGGVDNFTSFPGMTLINSPQTGNAWGGASLADPAADSASDLQAFAICYNPRGAAPGGTVSTLSEARATPQATQRADIPAEVMARLAEFQARHK